MTGEDVRARALELAKAVVRGECSTFGDEVPMSRALVSYAVENERLNTLVRDLGTHLTALCDHPDNWERRYDTLNGAPCPGCYDARDSFAAWLSEFGR